jgi:predicted short-subunit dehydrogenase-like oxidoreductase (DUF2520 family)
VAETETRLLVGDGMVARALAHAMRAEPPRRWWRAQGGAIPAADVVVLAVRDEAIADAAARVVAAMPPPILIHCAGALSAWEPFRALAPAPAGVAMMHPLVSVADASQSFAGVIFGVQGDAAGARAAGAIVRLVGGVMHPLARDADPALYHAAAALASNHVVGLVDAALELLRAAGLRAPEAVVEQLLRSTADNVHRTGLPAALTGPIARGDAATVERHLRALAAHPAIARVYRATAARVTDVAAAKGRADAAALAKIRDLLGKP